MSARPKKNHRDMGVNMTIVYTYIHDVDAKCTFGHPLASHVTPSCATCPRFRHVKCPLLETVALPFSFPG